MIWPELADWRREKAHGETWAISETTQIGEVIMHDLIKIVNTKISDAEIKTANARELHAFLESRQEFANWIKSRIADFGFIDDQDFLTILSKTPNGGRLFC